MVYEATDIPAYTEFWIVTGFPKGVVKYTWTARRIGAFIVPKVGFVLPILFFLGMLLIWRRRGRDDPAQDLRQLRERASVRPVAGAGRARSSTRRSTPKR